MGRAAQTRRRDAMSRLGCRPLRGSAEPLLSRLRMRWHSEAEILRRRGAEKQAAVLKQCACELEQERRLVALEELTLEQAVEESGYSYSALQKMVREGTIPNAGKKCVPRVRRCDLPKKPGGSNQPTKGEPDLAELVLAANS